MEVSRLASAAMFQLDDDGSLTIITTPDPGGNQLVLRLPPADAAALWLAMHGRIGSQIQQLVERRRHRQITQSLEVLHHILDDYDIR